MQTLKPQFQRLAVLAAAAAVFAGGSVYAQSKVQSKVQAPIYGSQLMTDAERSEYRIHMRTLKTRQEREAYRLEHHKLMQERARERGVTLPEMPPAMGKGMGPGPAAGRMRAAPPSGN